ncbi:MAG: tetratricopeptide repeat protein, partial [Parachlamydiaceae bacterium]
MVLIAKIATCAFPSLSAISELLQYYKNKKKESLEICQSIERKPLCGALKEQIAMTYASFSESDEECEAALLKIETLINELPRSIALYIGKIGLLITLNRIEEAEQSINRGVELFGYKESFIHLIVALYEEKKKDIDSAIKRLLEFYEKNPSDPCLTALIDCYNRHKSKEEKFLFLCETVFPTTFKLGYESYLSEIKEIFSHLENPREGLERLCSIKRGNNLDFLKIRADFLSEWGEYEKSLEDVDYLCHRQIKSAAISKISLLIQLARYTEAVQLALSLTDIPEITVSRLISALENEDGWAKEILLIGEKFKPKAYDARKSIAFAYVTLEAFDKALPLFNRLKSENNT